MIQIIVIGELGFTFALFALKRYFIQYFLNYQRMQFCSFVLNLAMGAISIPNLLGSEPLLYTVLAKPLFALKAFLWVKHHIMAYEACELILVILLVY